MGVPNSQTTFSVLGSAGVAVAAVAACVAATERLPRFTRLAAPVTAVGMIALTAYVLHVFAISVVGMEEATGPALLALTCTIATSMLLAPVWTRHFRRGPLEYLLYLATRSARHIK